MRFDLIFGSYMSNFSYKSPIQKSGKPIRVLIHGLEHFSSQFPAVLQSEGWDIRSYASSGLKHLLAKTYYLKRCDLAFSWVGRITMGKFVTIARALQKKRMVMFWCGSDVLEARKQFESRGVVESWIAEKVHWAGAPWLAEEVRAMGLSCEYVPATWVRPVEALRELPTQFSVLAYTPSARKQSLYGIDQVIEVARSMPEVHFTIAGLPAGEKLDVPKNVKQQQWVSQMSDLYDNSTVIWRPTSHDGLSFMALEALAHGRHLIWTYPFKGGVQANTASEAHIALQHLYKLHCSGQLKTNRSGAEFVSRNFSPGKIRDGILTRWQKIVESPSPKLPS